MSVYIFFVSFISNIELTKLFRFNVGKDMLSRSLVLPEGQKFQQRRPNLATVLKFLMPHPASKSYSSVLDHNLVRQFCPLRNTTAKIEPPSFSLHGEFFTTQTIWVIQTSIYFVFQFLRAGIKFLEAVV